MISKISDGATKLRDFVRECLQGIFLFNVIVIIILIPKGSSMSSRVDASGKMAGLEFLLFSGTGETMLHNFENLAF